MDSPLKWHGGKSRLASKLVDLTPPHICRVEPYGGALWYTLASDPEGASEVVNDMSYQLTNFWWTLRSEKHFRKMKRHLEATPFSEIEFKLAESRVKKPPDPIAAANFFVRCRQSRAGNFKSFAPVTKNRLRRGMNEQVSAWITSINGLEPVYHRLRKVFILSKPALDVISLLEAPGTHFYLDPPYMHGVRVSTDMYAHEMTDDDHGDLLDLITGKINGTIMISGKRCNLYDTKLKHWNRIDFDVPMDSASGKSKRRTKESVWLNYSPPKTSAA